MAQAIRTETPSRVTPRKFSPNRCPGVFLWVTVRFSEQLYPIVSAMYWSHYWYLCRRQHHPCRCTRAYFVARLSKNDNILLSIVSLNILPRGTKWYICVVDWPPYPPHCLLAGSNWNEATLSVLLFIGLSSTTSTSNHIFFWIRGVWLDGWTHRWLEMAKIPLGKYDGSMDNMDINYTPSLLFRSLPTRI